MFMGHADLQTVQRYIKLLPQRDERNPVDRLDTYLRATAGQDPAASAGREVDTEVDTTVSQRASAAKNGNGAMPEEGLEPPTRGL